MNQDDGKDVHGTIETDPLLQALGRVEASQPPVQGCPNVERIEEVQRGRGTRETLQHLNRCAPCRKHLLELAKEPEPEIEVPRARLDAICAAAEPRAGARRAAWWSWIGAVWGAGKLRPLVAVLALLAILTGLPWMIPLEDRGGDVPIEPFVHGALVLDPGLYRGPSAPGRDRPPSPVRIDPMRKVVLRWFPREAPGPGTLPSVVIGTVSEAVGSVVVLESRVTRTGDTLEVEIPAGQPWFAAAEETRRVVAMIGPPGESAPTFERVVGRDPDPGSRAGEGGAPCSRAGEGDWWVCWLTAPVVPAPGSAH